MTSSARTSRSADAVVVGNRTPLFVYGTLKRGHPNHAAYLGVEPILAPVTTLEPYPLVVAGPWYLPFLVNRPGRGRRVVGELYAVDAVTLERLDALEGVESPSGYYRGSIRVAPPAAAPTRVAGPTEVLEAVAYFKDDPPLPLHLTALSEYTDRRYRPDGSRA